MHYDSEVVRFVGHRGSGKSLLLAYSGLFDLMHGKRVWSNMPIKVSRPFAASVGMPGTAGLTSEPLDWDALYSLDQGLVQGTILIDECQYFSDSRSSNSLKNRLLNAIIAQVRKRSLNLLYSVKVGDWVDKRLTYETDIECQCSNLSYSDWGKQENIPPGAVINVKYFDLSGHETGRAIDKEHPWPYKELNFVAGRSVFSCYDTSKVVELEEAFTSVQLDLRKRVISNKQSQSDIEGTLATIAQQVKEKHGDNIPTVEFWNLVNSLGIEGSAHRLGRLLPGMGITRKQKTGGSYFYDLSKFNVENT